MNIYVKGNPISLTTRDFIASGGEGSVYALGGTAYKIYTDPHKMIPVDKIKELSALSAPNIIRPIDVIHDGRNHPIGYSMRQVQQTNALCQIFTKAFRDRNKITNDMIIKLVKNMQQTVQHIHQNNILVVDMNEMNFLVDDKFKEVFFIDVDSYQTKHYPATAIMESIRDRHCNGQWSQMTDWFSFGVVTFQMFVGIHPYRGKHPALNGFDERMLANASILGPNVTIPKVVLPFNVIPQNYLDWYKAVFQDGKRLPPPNDFVATIAIATKIQKLSGTNNFDIKEIFVFPDDIAGYEVLSGQRIVMTGDTLFINDKPQSQKLKAGTESFVSITPKQGRVMLHWIENRGIKTFDTTTNQLVDVRAAGWSSEQLMTYDGRLYARNGTALSELQWHESKTGVLPHPRLVANVHENAKLYDGVVMQNLLGKHYGTIVPETQKSYTIALPEVDGQVVDAKFDNNVLMVITSKAVSGGKVNSYQQKALEYTRYVYRFGDNYASYDVKLAKVKDFVPLNFVVMPSGVCCIINEDENVVLFRNKKDDPMVKIIDDPSVKGDVRLFKDEKQVVFASGETLYSLKLK